MKADPSAAMAAAAGHSLWQISNCGSSSQVARDEIIAAGALPLLIRDFSNHSSVAKVCEEVSHALYYIVDGSSAREAKVVAAGAVPLLVAAWRNHDGDSVRLEIRDALSELGYNPDGSKK